MIKKSTQDKEENKLNDKGNENLNETDNLKNKLEDANFLAEERLNHLKYLQADFDNYRKKFDKEKEQIIKLSNENLIQELIIILDDFDSSIKLMENEKNQDIPSNLTSQSGISNRHSRTESDTINWNVYKEGISRLYRKLFHILEKHGLKHIDALEKMLDPNLHEVLAKEKSDKEDGIIIEEIQKGYLLDSKVIRCAKVKISENKDNKTEENYDQKDLKTEKENIKI